MAKKTPKKKKEKLAKKQAITKEQKKASALKTPSKKKEKKPIIDFLEQTLGDKSPYLMLALLALVTTAVYGAFWFTDQVFLFKDIGSDTVNVFYPNYYWNAENWAKEGAFSPWSFSSGVGQNILAGSVGDPFVWLLYWAGKDAIIHWIGYIESFKIFLAGLTFFAYLKTIKMDNLAALTGGLFYAFSGFMMIGSGWYVFSIEGLYFALALLAFERFLMNGKWGLLPIVVFLISILQPVDTYMIAVLLGTYGTVRILDTNDWDWGDLGKKYLQLTALGILGIAMASVLLFPTLDQMINSPRVLGESSFADTLKGQSIFGFANTDLWATTKARLLAIDLLKDENLNFRGAMNYLEAPAIYVGLPILLLIPQAFVFLQKQAKILYGGLLALFLLPLLFPFLRYSFWLFSGDYFRIYSLFVIFILLFLGVRAIHEIHQNKKINWIALGIGLGLTLYLLFSISNSQIVVVNESMRSYLLFLIFIYTVLIALWSIDSLRSMARLGFLLVILIETISLGKPVLNNRIIAKAEEFSTQKIGYNDYSKDAVDWIKSKDNTFHRIEKNYTSYHKDLILHSSTNDAKVQGYFGSKSYHSFNQLNYVRFLGAMDIIDEKDENQTRWIAGVAMRPLVNFLLSNKYFLSNQGADKGIGFGYQYRHTVGNISIFENSNFLPLGFAYANVLDRATFDSLDKQLIQNIYGAKDIALLKAAVIETADLAAISLPQITANDINPEQYPMPSLTADIAILRQDTFEMESFKNSIFKGKITITAPQKMLFFSVPFDKGWSAIVDGKAANIYQTNIGFSGLLLSEGTHEITMLYTTPYLQIGFWISLGAFSIFGLLGLWSYRKRTENSSMEREI